MNATELFKANQLSEAIDAQLKEVKANPQDHNRRLFLFELLAFAGDLDRAARQIDAVSYGQMELDVAVLGYRKLLDAEKARRALFSSGQQPEFLLDPPEHVRQRLEAVNLIRNNQAAEASQVLAKAAEATPAVAGTLNNKPFTLLRDADDLFGGVFEVFAKGKYYWVPLEQVETLAMNAPRFPRDLLWVNARLEMRNGPKGEVYLPALYPGSHENVDAQIKLGRATDWKTLDGGATLGVGLRTFLVDDDPMTLLEWRELATFETEGEAVPEAPV
jgi:type VI secretion system protein ImpE